MGMDSQSCKCISIIVAVLAVAIVTISLIATSLEKLDSDEVGLKYDTIWKDLDKDPSEEGLHAGPPGFTFIIFPSVFKTLSLPDIRCLNKDGVTIELNVGYQYRAKQSELHRIIVEFKDHDGYEKVLFSAGVAAILEACSTYNLTQFQSERGLFSERVREKVVEKYDVLHCDITDLQVNNIKRPDSFEKVIRDKEAAKSQIQVAENERPRLETEARTKKREAETQANITIAKAESQARIIINKALANAASIEALYDKEAEAYEDVINSQGLQLSTKGFLSYIGVRTISSAVNHVYVGMKGPAKTSYVED